MVRMTTDELRLYLLEQIRCFKGKHEFKIPVRDLDEANDLCCEIEDVDLLEETLFEVSHKNGPDGWYVFISWARILRGRPVQITKGRNRGRRGYRLQTRLGAYDFLVHDEVAAALGLSGS